LYETIDVGKHQARPPSLFNTLTELPRTLVEMGSLFASFPLLSRLPRGDLHPVLLLPGFMASDDSTLMLRRYLLKMGYDPLPWSLGRNTGNQVLFEQKLTEKFSQLAETYQGKISIIGQSLGGVYARDLAHRFPDKIRQVITLGSPFRAMAAGATSPIVTELFKRQSGMSIEEMRDKLADISAHKTPGVPTTAIYSKGDGVVNWRVCLEGDSHQTESIEIRGSHCGMGFNPLIYCIVADRLSLPEGEWQNFDLSQLKKFSSCVYGF
jgi:pimeloyl-ACP methyl ester carboxylesterase